MLAGIISLRRVRGPNPGRSHGRECEFVAVVSWKVGWLWFFLHKICTRPIGRLVSQFYSSVGCFYPSGTTGRVVSSNTEQSVFSQSYAECQKHSYFTYLVRRPKFIAPHKLCLTEGGRSWHPFIYLLKSHCCVRRLVWIFLHSEVTHIRYPITCEGEIWSRVISVCDLCYILHLSLQCCTGARLTKT